MNKNSVSSSIISLIIIAVVEYTVFSIGAWSVMLLVGVPVLAAVFSIAQGKRALVSRLLFALVTSLLSAAFTGFSFSAHDVLAYLTAFLQLHLPAVAFVICLHRYNFELKSTVILASGANLTALIAELAVLKYFYKTNITQQIKQYFDEFTDTYISLISNTELAQNINTEMLTDVLELVQSAIVMLMPAILILMYTVITFITYKFTCIILANFTSVKPGRNTKLRYFSINSKLSLATLLLIVASYVFNNSYFTGSVYNFALIAGFSYIVNGIAVVDFFLAKRIKSSAGHAVAVVAIVLLSLVSGAFMSTFNAMSVLFFVGLLDVGRDFRRIRKMFKSK